MEKRNKNTTYSKLTFLKNENLGIEESQLICGGAVFFFVLKGIRQIHTTGNKKSYSRNDLLLEKYVTALLT